MNNRPAGLHPPPQTGITPNNAAPNSVVPNQRRSKQRSPKPAPFLTTPFQTAQPRTCVAPRPRIASKPSLSAPACITSNNAAPNLRHTAPRLRPPRPAAQSQHLHRPSPGICADSPPILRRHKPHAPVHTAPAYRLLPAAPVPLPLSKPGTPAPRHTFPATFRGLRPACNG